MNQQTKDEFLTIGRNLMEAFEEFDRTLRQHDRNEWERWKAGGKAVSDDFLSMYPSAEGIINTISEIEPDEDEEDEDNEEEGEDAPKAICPACRKEGKEGDGCPTCPGFWYSTTPDEDLRAGELNSGLDEEEPDRRRR